MLKIKVDNDSSTDIYLNSDILDVVIKFCEKTKHDLNSDSLKLSNIENLSDHMPFKCFEIVFDKIFPITYFALMLGMRFFVSN